MEDVKRILDSLSTATGGESEKVKSMLNQFSNPVDEQHPLYWFQNSLYDKPVKWQPQTPSDFDRYGKEIAKKAVPLTGAAALFLFSVTPTLLVNAQGFEPTDVPVDIPDKKIESPVQDGPKIHQKHHYEPDRRIDLYKPKEKRMKAPDHQVKVEPEQKKLAEPEIKPTVELPEKKVFEEPKEEIPQIKDPKPALQTPAQAKPSGEKVSRVSQPISKPAPVIQQTKTPTQNHENSLAMYETRPSEVPADVVMNNDGSSITVSVDTQGRKTEQGGKLPETASSIPANVLMGGSVALLGFLLKPRREQDD